MEHSGRGGVQLLDLLEVAAGLLAQVDQGREQCGRRGPNLRAEAVPRRTLRQINRTFITESNRICTVHITLVLGVGDPMNRDLLCTSIQVIRFGSVQHQTTDKVLKVH